MRSCKKCGKQIRAKAKIDGKWRNLSKRVHCLDCIPHGSPGYAPNAVKSTYRVQNNAVVTEYRQKSKERAIDYLGGKCWSCGYCRCRGALVFHHIDPAAKEFGVSDGRTRRWERVVEELKKCALLCHNCHSEVHYGVLDLDAVIKSR